MAEIGQGGGVDKGGMVVKHGHDTQQTSNHLSLRQLGSLTHPVELSVERFRDGATNDGQDCRDLGLAPNGSEIATRRDLSLSLAGQSEATHHHCPSCGVRYLANTVYDEHTGLPICVACGYCYPIHDRQPGGVSVLLSAMEYHCQNILGSDDSRHLRRFECLESLRRSGQRMRTTTLTFIVPNHHYRDTLRAELSQVDGKRRGSAWRQSGRTDLHREPESSFSDEAQRKMARLSSPPQPRRKPTRPEKTKRSTCGSNSSIHSGVLWLSSDVELVGNLEEQTVSAGIGVTRAPEHEREHDQRDSEKRSVHSTYQYDPDKYLRHRLCRYGLDDFANQHPVLYMQYRRLRAAWPQLREATQTDRVYFLNPVFVIRKLAEINEMPEIVSCLPEKYGTKKTMRETVALWEKMLQFVRFN